MGKLGETEAQGPHRAQLSLFLGLGGDPAGSGGALLSFHPLPFYLSAGDGCGHTVLAARSGTLSSRNYPGTYPNHTACRWQLRAPPGTSLILVFGDLDLEPSERCARSSLLLTDPDSGAIYGTGGTLRW